MTTMNSAMQESSEKYRTEVLARAESVGIQAYAPAGKRKVLLVVMTVEQMDAILEVLKGSEKSC